MEGTLAEIRMFAGNFAPRGWVDCNGQLLSIAQWTAVFALVGTTYGGNGQTTFAIPDFRGRVPIGTFQGAGLPDVTLGETSGQATITLVTNNIPAHNHTVSGSALIPVSSQDGHEAIPTNNYPSTNANLNYSSTTDNSTMAPATLALTTAFQAGGGSQQINNMKPFLAMRYIMCVEGIFPSRN